jgi:hypothetical protein
MGYLGASTNRSSFEYEYHRRYSDEVVESIMLVNSSTLLFDLGVLWSTHIDIYYVNDINGGFTSLEWVICAKPTNFLFKVLAYRDVTHSVL